MGSGAMLLTMALAGTALAQDVSVDYDEKAFITGQCCGASWTGSVEMAACEHFVAEGEAR